MNGKSHGVSPKTPHKHPPKTKKRLAIKAARKAAR